MSCIVEKLYVDTYLYIDQYIWCMLNILYIIYLYIGYVDTYRPLFYSSFSPLFYLCFFFAHVSFIFNPSNLIEIKRLVVVIVVSKQPWSN
jgi:hypothetical protein